MNPSADQSKRKNMLNTAWRNLKPWIIFGSIFLILRFTGALAGITSVTNQVVLLTGILDADPSNIAVSKEPFDYNFAIKTLDGNIVDFNQYKGKTVFLNMWATWCGPCRAEMPSIQKLYDKVNTDSIAFVMLSIDAEAHQEKVSRYVESNGFTFPVFIAADLPAQLQVSIIPTTFVVTKEGTLAYKKAGMADYDTKQFKKFLEKLTAK